MFSFTRKFQLLAVLSCFCLASCHTTGSVAPAADEISPSTVLYTIKKGEHDSGSPIILTSVARIRFDATFDTSAIYRTQNEANQGDINKLYGVADCRTDHHTNSARFGWRWYNDQLEIHAYTYQNKVRQSKLVGVVELNKTYTYDLKLEEHKYVFSLNGTTVTLPRHCSGPAEGYQLYPYFGGDEVAPHDITIAIRDI